MKINLQLALKICRDLEAVVPEAGCHVALTGGCLYKDGDRKDIDILFYRIRQKESIDYKLLFEILAKQGVEIYKQCGWCQKATYFGEPILDLFFPEDHDAPKGDLDEDYGD